MLNFSSSTTTFACAIAPDTNTETNPDKIKQDSNKNINLHFPEGWLENHSMTLADLTKEIDYLDAAGYKLSFD